MPVAAHLLGRRVSLADPGVWLALSCVPGPLPGDDGDPERTQPGSGRVEAGIILKLTQLRQSVMPQGFVQRSAELCSPGLGHTVLGPGQHRECGLVLRTVCDDGVSVSVLRL